MYANVKEGQVKDAQRREELAEQQDRFLKLQQQLTNNERQLQVAKQDASVGYVFQSGTFNMYSPTLLLLL
jgi:hypothetical protein